VTPIASDKRLIGIRAVRARYGDVNARTIDRWLKRQLIPPPDRRINNRRYWYEHKLDRHDRQRVAASAAEWERPQLKEGS
jgi:DNA-binding transcriptional MerR regulator